MKFIHAADVHLRTAVKNVSAGEDAAQQERRFAALTGLMRYAARRDCAFVLLCGDLSDCARLIAADTDRISAAFASFGGAVYLTHGNWDAYTVPHPYDGIKYKNLFIFGDKPATYTHGFGLSDKTAHGKQGISVSARDNSAAAAEKTAHGKQDISVSAHDNLVSSDGKTENGGISTVSGVSLARDAAGAVGFSALDLKPGAFNIVCAHGDADPNKSVGPRFYNPIDPDAFPGRNVSYLALGHDHSPKILRRGAFTCAYAGSLTECAGFAGSGGCFEVSVENGGCALKRVGVSELLEE
jgi:DNA repair exonuclease SbcCD nuclease subunit